MPLVPLAVVDTPSGSSVAVLAVVHTLVVVTGATMLASVVIGVVMMMIPGAVTCKHEVFQADLRQSLSKLLT